MKKVFFLAPFYPYKITNGYSLPIMIIDGYRAFRRVRCTKTIKRLIENRELYQCIFY